MLIRPLTTHANQFCDETAAVTRPARSLAGDSLPPLADVVAVMRPERSIDHQAAVRIKEPAGKVGCTPEMICCEATFRTMPLPDVLVLTAVAPLVTVKVSVNGVVTVKIPVKSPWVKVGLIPPYSIDQTMLSLARYWC